MRHITTLPLLSSKLRIYAKFLDEFNLKQTLSIESQSRHLRIIEMAIHPVIKRTREIMKLRRTLLVLAKAYQKVKYGSDGGKKQRLKCIVITLLVRQHKLRMLSSTFNPISYLTPPSSPY
jgi:hypothetical protein